MAERVWKLIFVILLICTIFDVIIKYDSNVNDADDGGGEVKKVWKHQVINIRKVNVSKIYTKFMAPVIEKFANDSDCLRDLSDDLTGPPNMVFFTKIPRTGSTKLMDVMKLITKENITHPRYRLIYSPAYESMVRQDQFADLTLEEFMPNYWKPPCPKVVGGHSRFTDFRPYGKENPIFVSLVREPLARAESNYYYGRKMGFIPLNGKTFEDCLFDAKCFVVGQCVTFSYFCGTEENCIKACQLNDKLLMQNIYQRTLQQVDQIYSVVLVLENMKNSFRLLEAMHPQFFAGITKKMQGEVKKNENKSYEKKKKNPETRKLYCQIQPLDCQIYEYFKQKLDKQLKQWHISFYGSQ